MLFKVLQPYHKEFIPKLSSEEFPTPISEMYNPATLKMNYTELLKESEKAFDKLKVCIILLYIPGGYISPYS